MFGRKKKEAKKQNQEQPMLKIEQMIKEYSTVNDFQKGQKRLAKEGWYIKAQSTKHDTGMGVFFGIKHDIILVTFEREVTL